jgi:hypothetical protein
MVDLLPVNPFTGTSAIFWSGVVLVVPPGTSARNASVVRFVHVTGISVYLRENFPVRHGIFSCFQMCRWQIPSRYFSSFESPMRRVQVSCLYPVIDWFFCKGFLEYKFMEPLYRHRGEVSIDIIRVHGFLSDAVSGCLHPSREF